MIIAKTIPTIYFKGEEEDIKLPSSLHSKGRIRRLNKILLEFKCPYLKPGLCDWVKIDINFQNLADCLGVDDDDNEKILKKISNLENKKEDREWERKQEVKAIDAEQEGRKSLEYTVDELLAKIASLRLIKKWSITLIWAKLKISREDIGGYFCLI